MLIIIYLSLQISANGIMTFESDLLLYLTPQPFPVIGSSYIAPYWFDNSILNKTSSTVHYRQVADNFTLLTRAAREIRTAFPNAAEFQPITLHIITWSIGSLQRNGYSQSHTVCNI